MGSTEISLRNAGSNTFSMDGTPPGGNVRDHFVIRRLDHIY
jgi:hypothetical protein